MQRSSRSVLPLVFAVVLTDLLGFGIIIPIQPFYARQLGCPEWAITLIGATYSLCQFLCAPLWGNLSDRRGRRPVLLCSIAITALGHLLFAFAGSVPALFAARAIAGIGAANIATAQAVISDVSAPDERAKRMGLIGAAFGLGFIFGPVIGGFLGQISPYAPPLAAAFLSIANLIFASFFLPETKTTESSPQRRPLLAALSALDPTTRRLATTTLIVSIAFASMEQTVGLFIGDTWFPLGVFSAEEQFRYSSFRTGVYLFFVGITATVLQGMLIGKLVKRFGEIPLIRAGIIGNAVGLIATPLLGSTSSFPLFIVSGILLAAGSGLLGPTTSSVISKRSGDTGHGLALAVNQSAAALGRVIGPATAGLLYTNGKALPFVIGAILTLSSLFLVNRLKPDEIGER